MIAWLDKYIVLLPFGMLAIWLGLILFLPGKQFDWLYEKVLDKWWSPIRSPKDS